MNGNNDYASGITRNNNGVTRRSFGVPNYNPVTNNQGVSTQTSAQNNSNYVNSVNYTSGVSSTNRASSSTNIDGIGGKRVVENTTSTSMSSGSRVYVQKPGSNGSEIYIGNTKINPNDYAKYGITSYTDASGKTVGFTAGSGSQIVEVDASGRTTWERPADYNGGYLSNAKAATNTSVNTSVSTSNNNGSSTSNNWTSLTNNNSANASTTTNVKTDERTTLSVSASNQSAPGKTTNINVMTDKNNDIYVLEVNGERIKGATSGKLQDGTVIDLGNGQTGTVRNHPNGGQYIETNANTKINVENVSGTHDSIYKTGEAADKVDTINVEITKNTKDDLIDKIEIVDPATKEDLKASRYAASYGDEYSNADGTAYMYTKYDKNGNIIVESEGENVNYVVKDQHGNVLNSGTSLASNNSWANDLASINNDINKWQNGGIPKLGE